MADPVEKAKDVQDAVAHPVDTAKSLEQEAEAGRSARTPAIAISGVMLVIGAALTILLIVLFAVFYLNR